MHNDPLHSMIPLERYRTLIGTMVSQNDGWNESFWLRFAAQAVVMCPDSPPLLARRIREIADALLEHSTWYQTLASPARFVVSAMLIQQNIPVARFSAEHARIAEMMSGVGLRHGRFYETVAVLILLMSPDHQPSSMLEMERLKAIYDQMKRFHWWLTGPDDLPACAALAQCPGSAEVLVARVEEAYQQLHATGVPTGEHLQTAANLLPLAGIDINQAVARYRGLAAALTERTGALGEAHYDPLALLTLLDHEPGLVIQRLTAVSNELDLFQPEEQGAANILIASDLTFLDLVRCDRNRTPLTQTPAAAGMLRTLHAYHLASAVLLSQVEPHLVQLVGAIGASPGPYL